MGQCGVNDLWREGREEENAQERRGLMADYSHQGRADPNIQIVCANTFSPADKPPIKG